MTESENHIASASDFRSAREVDHKVERVVLPQLGKAVLMRRPAPLWFIFRGQLPQSLAVRASGETGGPRAVEDVLRLGRWISELPSAACSLVASWRPSVLMPSRVRRKAAS